MLITLLIWSYITILSVIWGMLFVKLVTGLFGLKEQKPVPLPVLCFSGLAMMTAIAVFLSLFIKTGLAAHLAAAIPPAVYLVFRHKDFSVEIKKYLLLFKNYSKITLFLSVFFTLIILMETSLFFPRSFDTALYHAQAIHWLEKYPAVPGLGNLHMCLSYNSVWLIAGALFSFSFIPGISFHVLNGLCLLWALAYFLDGIDSLLKGNFSLANAIKALLVVVAFYLYAGLSSSPATDMPVSLLIWILFLIFLEIADDHSVIENSILGFAAVLLVSFLIVVKLSGLPMIIFLIAVIIRQFYSGRKKGAYFSIGILLFFMLPWMARNAIQTGYLIYPFDKIDIFNFDWKVPMETLKYDVKWIGLWGNKLVLGNGIFKAMALWFSTLWFEQKILFYPLAAFSGLSFIYLMLRNAKEGRIFKKIRRSGIRFLVVGTSIFGVLFLFFTVPGFRFGAGILTFFCLLPIAAALSELLSGKKQAVAASKIYAIALIAMTLAVESVSTTNYFHHDRRTAFIGKDGIENIPRRILLPAAYPVNDPRNMLEFKYPQGIIIYVPDIGAGANCWYEPFPSSAYYHRDLETRGKTLREGFRRGLK